MDEDLIVQMPIIREYLDSANVFRYEQEGIEADDIIGSISRKYSEHETVILSSDRDLLQLIDASTSVLLMKKGITEMHLVDEILCKLETADNTTKNQLENKLVEQGSVVVPELVSKLQSVRGVQRGVVAMTLIRIGEASIEYLRRAASDNKDFEWVAKYLISEIQGIAA